jgi:hypothetical protein
MPSFFWHADNMVHRRPDDGSLTLQRARKGVIPEVHTLQSSEEEEWTGAALHSRGAGNQSFHAPPRTIALSGVAVVAFILSLVWCLYAKELPGVDGKWVQAERQAAYQANPDDYVEGFLTLVLRRAGATDISQ